MSEAASGSTVQGTPFSPGVLILGGGGVLLMLFLLVGFLLPQGWEAEATAELPVPASAVYPLLDSPEGWRGWTPWPESGVVRSGPARGAGASLSWDDPELGDGSFTIVSATEPTRVDYAVRVEGGSMRTDGSLTLEPVGPLGPVGAGVRVTWREQGDLGWSPLMGYWALSMRRAQSAELAKGLDRLRALAEERAAQPPDSVAVTPPASSGR